MTVAPETLESPRLILEPLVQAHASVLFVPLCDPQLYRYIPQDPPISREALSRRYAALEVRRSPDGTEAWLNWAVRRRDSAAYVGTMEATVLSDSTASIAYFIFRPYWRRGYAREACTAVLNQLRVNPGVRRVGADVDTRNLASIRLLESLGFRREKLTTGADYFKGSSSDEYHYATIFR